MTRYLLGTVVVSLAACSHDIADVRALAETAAPIIDRFAPSAGLAGQTVVEVQGRNFPADARVYFGTLEGVWAIGPAYTYSDTLLYAIPPFGSASQVELSVRGSTGEAEAQSPFLVFDSEPEITEISSERISHDTRLVIRGRNFNAADPGARLFIADQELFGMTIGVDQIGIDLATMTNFSAIGSGWKLLRYRFTPYVEGDPEETAIATYVVQPPVVDRIDQEVFSRGILQVSVRGYDAYRAPLQSTTQDNPLFLGGQALTILDAWPSTTDPEVVLVNARVPELANDTVQTFVATNVAGSSAAVTVAVAGPGGTSAVPQLGECKAVGLSGRSGAPQYQSIRHGSRRYGLAVGMSYYDDEHGDALAVEGPNRTYALRTAARLGSFLSPFYIHRLAYVADFEPGTLVILAADGAPSQSGGPAGSAWEVTTLKGGHVCHVALAGVTQPSHYSEYGPPPEILGAGPADSRSVAIWFRGHFDDDDEAWVIRLPDPSAPDCAAITAQRLALSGHAELAALTHSGADSYLALSFASAVEVWRVADSGSPPPSVSASQGGLLRPVALAQNWESSFSIVDASARLVWELQVGGGASSTSFTGYLEDPYDAFLSVDGAWWLGGSRSIHVLPAAGGFVPETDLLLPAGASVRRFSADWGPSDPDAVILQSGGYATLVAGLQADAAGRPQLSYQEVFPFSFGHGEVWFDSDRRLVATEGTDAVVFDPELRTATSEDLATVARQVVPFPKYRTSDTYENALVVSVANLTGSTAAAPELFGMLGVATSSGPGQPWRQGGDPGVLFESPAGADVYPVAAASYQYGGGNPLAFAALYRVDGQNESIEVVRLQPWATPTPTFCTLGALSRPRTSGLSPLEVLGRNGLELALEVVPDLSAAPRGGTGGIGAPGKPGAQGARLFMLLTGPYWNGVVEIPLSAALLTTSQCDAPRLLAGRIDLAPGGGMPLSLSAASVDRRGQRLVVLLGGEAMVADIRVPATTYPLTEIATDTQGCGSSFIDARATTRGALFFDKQANTLCEAALPLGYATGDVAGSLWHATVPMTSAKMVLAPNEAEVWLLRDNQTSSGVRVFVGAQRYAMGSGVSSAELVFWDQPFTAAAFDVEGRELQLLRISTWPYSVADWLTRGAASVCAVR
ncbi:MAG: hypothetical protein HY903_23980 [Deltaproteobacteria bacterium]|nr:hypothetical protein [Deltaproteobacteria bacterium]